MVVKCDFSAPNSTDIAGVTEEKSPYIVTTENRVTTTTTTIATIVTTISSIIQTSTAGVLSFFQVKW